MVRTGGEMPFRRSTGKDFERAVASLARSGVMEPGKRVDRGEAVGRWKGRIFLGGIGEKLGGNNCADRHSRGGESRTCHRVADAAGGDKTPSCC